MTYPPLIDFFIMSSWAWLAIIVLELLSRKWKKEVETIEQRRNRYAIQKEEAAAL